MAASLHCFGCKKKFFKMIFLCTALLSSATQSKKKHFCFRKSGQPRAVFKKETTDDIPTNGSKGTKSQNVQFCADIFCVFFHFFKTEWILSAKSYISVVPN